MSASTDWRVHKEGPRREATDDLLRPLDVLGAVASRRLRASGARRPVRAGTRLNDAGEPCHVMRLVTRGLLEVAGGNETPTAGVLRAGDLYGTHCWQGAASHPYDVRAVVASEVFEFPSSAVRAIVEEDPEGIHQRWLESPALRSFALELLQEGAEAAIAQDLLMLFRRETLLPGCTVVEKGMVVDSLLVVERGSVVVRGRIASAGSIVGLETLLLQVGLDDDVVATCAGEIWRAELDGLRRRPWFRHLHHCL